MPSPPRAYWKGYLRLSLVSIGVELYAATVSAESAALHGKAISISSKEFLAPR